MGLLRFRLRDMKYPLLSHVRGLSLALAAVLVTAACGGGGGGYGGSNNSGGGGGTGSTCSLATRQNWVVSQMNEWYLYPETLPTNINVANYASVDALISALIATAKSQNKDRDFTYITSIAQENALINSGATAGFGILLYYDLTARRVFILEAYETAPAYATVNIDRGDEIIAIGTSANDMRLVSAIIAAEGRQGVSNALGPSTAGLIRVLRIARGSVVRDVTVAKADYSLEPISPRYGARIIDYDGKRYGYLHLRTFIVSAAEDRLKEEFLKFRNAGVTEIVIDFRYNGGGLVRVANTMGDLLGGNRQTSEIFSTTVFRASKASNNSTQRFSPQPQSISPTKLAFITTSSSASASELVINSFIPYFNNQLALIGGNTFGKPVGQIAADNSACDDRLRVLAFTTQNSASSDAYFNGLAEAVKASCRANDDFTQALGSTLEGSTRQALDWLQGRACTPIPATSAQAAAASGIGQGTTIEKDTDLQLEPVPVSGPPTPAQREIPGLF